MLDAAKVRAAADVHAIPDLASLSPPFVDRLLGRNAVVPHTGQQWRDVNASLADVSTATPIHLRDRGRDLGPRRCSIRGLLVLGQEPAIYLAFSHAPKDPPRITVNFGT